MNSITRRISLIIWLTVIYGNVFPQGNDVTTQRDLFNRWEVFEENQYRPFLPNDAGTEAIYLRIEGNEFSGQKLRIFSYARPTIFINGKLLERSQQHALDLNIDSVRLTVGSSLLVVGVYQKNITPENLGTYLLSEVSMRISNAKEDVDIVRSSVFFRDFIIVGTLVLLIFLVILIRQNGKLASDYFSVKKIFLLQEVEDSHVPIKITGGSNLLYYIFCSLVVSFSLMIIFHFVGDHFSVAWLFRSDSFASAVGQWIKLSIFVFVVIVVKIFIVFLGTRLFGLPEIAGLQIFNWIRLLFVASGVIAAFLVFYNVSSGQNENIYLGLFRTLSWVAAGWLLILFPKVARRSPFPMFHIFSYLCATEIIPLLISIKLLYY